MKKSRKKIAVIIVSIVAVIAVVSSTLAYFRSDSFLIQNGKLFGFSGSARVYFQQDDGSTVAASKDDKGLYKLSLDSNADNYVGKLRVDVYTKGHAKCYIRVKMNVEWTLPDGTVTQNILLPYKFADKWYDNRTEDYCIYYTSDDNLKNVDKASVITGFDEQKFINNGLTESATPKASISVETVQINRYSQIWGIDKLPWE